MAASGKVGGYKCEFINLFSDDFVCKICQHVAREPKLTSCCTETFCQACIAQVLEDKKPCPSCQGTEFTTLLNVKYQKRILSLEVHCTMKDRGCGWNGKLEGLDTHLDVDTGDCQYADVPCPDCHQQVQKHELPTHLADACPQRDYNCRYCGFSGTYEVVCNDHWPECEQYPIPCPNYCGLGAIERCTLEDHLPLCPMQEVECDFSHAGCTEKFLRQDLEKHMEKNTQKHLVLMSAATLRISQEFEKKLQVQQENFQKQLEEKERETAKLLQQKSEQLDRIESHLAEMQIEYERRLGEKDKQIHEHEVQLTRIHEYCGTPPFHFTLQHFTTEMAKPSPTSEPAWLSPPMYTHLYGYTCTFHVEVVASGYGDAHGTHVSLFLWSAKGAFDGQLKWPAKCSITLELLNQHRDQDHVTVTKVFTWSRPTSDKPQYAAIFSKKFVAYTDLGWNAQKRTQYLKDDCLHFRIPKVELLL